jgi:hypothetical protein
MNRNFGRHIVWFVIGGMICFISACNNDSVSEEQAESFLKYYAAGNDVNTTGTVVIQISDGYAIMGNFENVSGQQKIFVVFTDEFGRQKTSEPIEIGTDLNDHGYSMIRLGDGYLISGTSFNTTTTQKWGYLVNISSEGRILWEQNYSGYQELVFRDAALASDGHIIITGHSKRTTEDDTEAIIVKTSATGDLMWLRSYNYAGRDDVGEAIIEDQGRYHVITTSTAVSNIRLSRIRILNTNTNGGAPTSYELQKNYYSGKDITLNTAGNMYILGNVQDPVVARESNIFLAELELTWNGSITSLKDSATISYQESLHAESFAPVEQIGLAIGGWQIKPNDNDILLLRVNNEFEFEMLIPYGTKGSQTAQNIIYTGDDGGFALTGSVDLAGGTTSMLLKVGADGELK